MFDSAKSYYGNILNGYGLRSRVFKWDVSSTIFPDINNVEAEWISLKERILNNKTVYIRGCGKAVDSRDIFNVPVNNNLRLQDDFRLKI